MKIGHNNTFNVKLSEVYGSSKGTGAHLNTTTACW